MKKIIGLFVGVLFCGSMFSQNDTIIKNKNGFNILPVANEIGLGVDAAPFLHYVGDIFGNTGANTAIDGDRFLGDYFSSKTVYAKYMLTPNSAVRATMRLTNIKVEEKYFVFNDAENSPDSTLVDSRTSRSNEFNLGIGYEVRRGKTRLQGLFGGEVFLLRRNSNTLYEYGNAFTSSNNTPTSSFDVNGVSQGEFGSNVAERILSNDEGKTKGIGVRAFVGVEYFFAPRICLGTEFGFAVSRLKTTDSKITTAYFDAISNGIIENVTTTAGSLKRTVDTDNFNGSLYLMFYF